MSIEKPSANTSEGAPVQEAMEQLIKTQVQFNPEYQKLNLTPEEIREAARRLSNAEVAGSDKELAEKAIRAQVSMRRSNRAPVVGNTGEVIGMATTPEEAEAMVREANEHRDTA